MQVTFDFANQRITVDGEGAELVSLFTLVRDIAPKIPSITFTASGTTAPSVNTPPANGHLPQTATNQTGSAPPPLREFVRKLSPGSMSEKIAVISYYYLHYLNRPTFSPKEMADWFTQAGVEKPNQMPVACFDAKKRNGYVESAGHGVWRIATQGENLVIRKMQQPTEKE